MPASKAAFQGKTSRVGAALANGSGVSNRTRAREPCGRFRKEHEASREGVDDRSRCYLGDQKWAGGTGLLRPLSGRHDESSYFGGPCHAGLFSQETLAARRMLEHVGQFGIHPQNLAADKAYGSGELLAWLLAFQSLIVSTKHEDCLPERRSATSPKKMPITVPKENHCIIEVSGAAVEAIFIARQKLSAGTVHKRRYVPQVPIGDCSFIGRNQRDK